MYPNLILDYPEKALKIQNYVFIWTPISLSSFGFKVQFPLLPLVTPLGYIFCLKCFHYSDKFLII